MTTPKLRVYYLPNLDGTRSALVAAQNQKEACKLIGVSVKGFRDYGGQCIDDPARVSVAISDPRVVWIRRIDYGPTPMPWLKRNG